MLNRNVVSFSLPPPKPSDFGIKFEKIVKDEFLYLVESVTDCHYPSDYIDEWVMFRYLCSYELGRVRWLSWDNNDCNSPSLHGAQLCKYALTDTSPEFFVDLNRIFYNFFCEILESVTIFGQILFSSCKFIKK